MIRPSVKGKWLLTLYGTVLLSVTTSVILDRFEPNLHDKHDPQKYVHYDVIVENSSNHLLKPFWKSTGLCPGAPHQQADKYFLSNDMKQNLFHIGSLPYRGIIYIRMHWLLDLVHTNVHLDGSVSFDFTSLDDLIHELWKNNLYPGFEIMGNPSNYFTDFENVTQVYLWRDLVATLAKHYITLYGISYLEKWNFETWNEPDHHDFDNLNFTIQGFLNYYDACSEGLRLADKRLKLGGPGGSCRIPGEGHSPICWALLKHCLSGKNFFSGKIGNRLDFISFHKKGNASSFDILDSELETIKYMRKVIKVPPSIPFYNDEADPLKNWALPLLWRADATYAAMATKIILSHIYEYYVEQMHSSVYFDLLSNDNAFLSYFPHQFTQRTLLGRFQINNTKTQYVELIKKPIFSIFGLLSQLCPQILTANVYSSGKKINPVSNFGVLATLCSLERHQIVIIMHNSADSLLSNVTFDVNIILSLSSFLDKIPDGGKGVTLEINNVDTNPYLMWVLSGKPAYPTPREFSLIKDQEGPHVSGPWNVKVNSSLKFSFKLPNPSVSLINICLQKLDLKMVRFVRFFKIRNDTLQISWTDDYNRCVLTYLVEYSLFSKGSFVQLNQKKVVFPSYRHYVSNGINSTINGFYRIGVVDFWSTTGPFSLPEKFHE